MKRHAATLRMAGSVLAGMICFVVLEKAFNLVAHAVWPAYALASPERAFSLEMLQVRLFAGTIATIVAAAVTDRIAASGRNAALLFGIALLAFSVVWHIRIWAEYPVWYHLAWFAVIMPAAEAGGRLQRSPGPATT